MKYRRKITGIAAAALIASLAASSFVLHRVDQQRPQATLDEVLFSKFADGIKLVASLGYNGLMACIYWSLGRAIFRETASIITLPDTGCWRRCWRSLIAF